MTPHGRTTIGFLSAAVLLLLLDLLRYPIPIWSYLLLGAVYLTIAAIGSARIDSNYHIPAVCNGPRDRDRIALSFDDGPDPRVTPALLDLLKERDIKASFFLIGKKVKEEPELVERIHREGHHIGNHSWSHSYFFDLFSAKKMARELEDCSEAIRSITGTRPSSFRPPYGVTNPMLRKAVQRSGLRTIGWDVRSLDVNSSEGKCRERILKKVRPGSVILLHDTEEMILKLLPGLIDTLTERGYELRPLEEVLQNPD